jgi:hypothetical protein
MAAALLEPLSPAEERTLKAILAEPMDYIDHPDFQLPDAEQRIYGIGEIERPDVTWYRPLMDDFIAARSRTVRSPKSQSTILLTGAQERILFMKYNFARFSISEIQKRAASRPVTLEEARQLLRWHGTAHKYREQLAETNLALVLAMAVFVIDTAGVVQYEEVVPEVTNEPDYAAAMAALEALLLPHKRRTARRRPPAARKRTVSRATKKT